MDTFQVQKGVVEHLQNKITQNIMFIKDGRGQHQHPITNTLVIIDEIRNHIDGFPRYFNHYSRRKQGDEYLSSDLNVRRMFQAFRLANPQLQEVEHKETLYRQVFRGMDIRIGLPRSDTCKSCDQLLIALELAQGQQNRLLAENDLNQHHIHADTAYLELNDDMAQSRLDPSYIVICGDLQQVEFCTINI
jgi:hypothetical protein